MVLGWAGSGSRPGCTGTAKEKLRGVQLRESVLRQRITLEYRVEQKKWS